MQRFRIWLLFFSLTVFFSCTKDKLPAPMNNCQESYTYQTDVKPILDASCAYSGCHVAGFSKGNHTSYLTLKPQLDNGIFKKWVINDRSMPPAYAPSDKPKSLTDEQINIISCWAEAGYPEN